jgi:hypothetical protein
LAKAVPFESSKPQTPNSKDAPSPKLQEDDALEKVAGYGFDPGELKALPDLQFVARNLDIGGEPRGRIKI